ncbi:MAG TPA: ABC transporter ATP-binding protein [Streptosporangiaceae bacterium]|nr:ABC transporter ATP-binding protein [Streptosporangiaceae bacterium]
MTLAVEVDELVRTYTFRKGKSRDGGGKSGQVVALDSVSLSVDHGEVHGLLGPNGAGKTTLVKILSTVLLPTSGTARVFGHDVVSSTRWVRERIGVVFGGERGLYGRISARQNLEYWAALYRLGRRAGRARVDDLLAEFGLSEFADMPVDRMSRGMKQRLHLARGMLNRPQLLFLDEPTIGMDPVATREFHGMFAHLRAGDTTVLLTTHDMAEAEQLCDMVTLIDHGTILGTERPQDVGQWISEYERVEARISDTRILAAIRALPGVARLESLPDDWVRINTNGPGAVADVLQLIVGEGITALRVDKPSLQEVYLQLIGDRGMKV